MKPSVDPDLGRSLYLARRGNQAALGQLLEKYRHYLTLLTRLQLGRMLRSQVDAAELVQETLLEAHYHFAGFQGSTEAEWVGWLRGLLGTTVSHLLRRYPGAQRRDVHLRPQLALDLDRSSRIPGQVVPAAQSTPSQQAVRREPAVLLADALQRLPAENREAIILRQLEGLSFPEVAQRMHRSLDSVKKLWIRGLDQLHRVLREPH